VQIISENINAAPWYDVNFSAVMSWPLSNSAFSFVWYRQEHCC